MSAYMRNQFAFLGLPKPVWWSAAREALGELPKPDQQVLAEVTTACWRRPEREYQYAAVSYLRRHLAVTDASFLPVAERLVRTKSWWDTVDDLARNVVGSLVASHPELQTEMDRWVESEDIWIARTAILHQLAYRDRTDRKRLFAYSLRRAHETEFFLRKAIGWALREYSKTEPEAVVAFVRENDATLSGLSKREALAFLRASGSL